MFICEEDLFSFVFFSDTLTPEILRYLSTGSEFYEELNFYAGLKKKLESEPISYTIINSIKKKIDIGNAKNERITRD